MTQLGACLQPQGGEASGFPLQCVGKVRFTSLRTSDRCHWCGNPYSPKTASLPTFFRRTDPFAHASCAYTSSKAPSSPRTCSKCAQKVNCRKRPTDCHDQSADWSRNDKRAFCGKRSRPGPLARNDALFKACLQPQGGEASGFPLPCRFSCHSERNEEAVGAHPRPTCAL